MNKEVPAYKLEWVLRKIYMVTDDLELDKDNLTDLQKGMIANALVKLNELVALKKEGKPKMKESGKQSPPKPGMESFKGQPVSPAEVNVPKQSGIGKREKSTKND